MKTLYKVPISELNTTQRVLLVGNKLGHIWQVCYSPNDLPGEQLTSLNGGKIDAPIDFYYTYQIPLELAKVLEEVKKQLELHPTTDLFISPQEARTILKYL